MMKTNIRKARVHVTARFKREGSVLRETIEGSGVGFDTRLEIESEEPAEKLASVVRNAENGCYVMQTILKPTPVNREVSLNGAAFNPDEYPKPSQ